MALSSQDSIGQDAAPTTVLIDVSRLVWRFWSRRLPTGIDRVCLAYLDHYADGARAVVQRGARRLVLSPNHSKRLFDILRAGPKATRAQLVRCLALALPLAARSPPRRAFFLNVGHTGLDEPGLPAWVARHRLRAIYMVHDLIPLTHPEYCRPGEAARHEQRMANLLASAHGVIGNSQATLDALAAFAGARGLPMPNAVAAWISGPPAIAPGPAPLAAPYFVALGTIEGRKNHILLLDLWADLVATMGEGAPSLAIIGQRGWQADAVFERLDAPAEFAGKMIELGRCSDAELAAWLGGARALLMPSFAEGFGLPLIEALALGTPVIASDLAVFREIAGAIPLFLGPLDRAAWRAAVVDLSGDGPERARQLAAMADFRAPGWDDHFAIVDRWLATLHQAGGEK